MYFFKFSFLKRVFIANAVLKLAMQQKRTLNVDHPASTSQVVGLQVFIAIAFICSRQTLYQLNLKSQLPDFHPWSEKGGYAREPHLLLSDCVLSRSVYLRAISKLLNLRQMGLCCCSRSGICKCSASTGLFIKDLTISAQW